MSIDAVMISGTPKLNAALAIAQSEFAPIIKSKTAQVAMKSGGGYTFNFADLQDVIAATTPALSKNGLSITMPIDIHEKFGVMLRVILRHSSGESVETMLPIKIPDGKPQELGSLLSYYRRYLLSALLNVASEDDDGNLAQGNEANIAPKSAKIAIEKKMTPVFYTGSEEEKIVLRTYFTRCNITNPAQQKDLHNRSIGKGWDFIAKMIDDIRLVKIEEIKP